MSSKHIQKLASLNNHAYCYIFSTDCGIMPGRLAEKKKIGGYPLIQAV